MKRFLSFAVAGLVIVGCHDAQFTRSGDTGKASNTADGTNPNGTNPNGTNPNGTNPNGTNPNTTDPNSPGYVAPGSTDPNNPFFEGLNPNPYFQSFGGNSILWHIGDAAWTASSCKFKIDFHSVVEGRGFSFYFNVQQDNTTISINMKYCGVDYAGSMAQVYGPGGAGDVRDTQQLNPTNDWGIFTMYSKTNFNTLTLNAGTYRVHVTSVTQGTDLDDYLVGRVNLSPNKPITLGAVQQD